MIRTVMKWVAGAATLTTRNDQEPSYNPDRDLIVSTILRMFAVVLLVIAYGRIDSENFASGYSLALFAGLLLAATSDLARYFRYLHWLNRTQLAELRGLRPRGEHVGDGIPRNLSGRPFEPLTGWEGRRS